MVQTEIKGEVERERLPAAPWDDEVIIQSLADDLVDDLLGRSFTSQYFQVPKEMLLGFVRDGRLRVLSPLQVKFTYEGKHTIAEAVELDEFGFGENVSEAITDLQRTITELYFTLENEQERLGVDLQRIWNVLQDKMLKR